MTRTSVRQRIVTAGTIAAMAVISTSCGEVARTGRSAAILVIESLEGASGAEPDEFSPMVLSDVQTLVAQRVNGQEIRVPTIYNDLGRANLRLTPKNPGTSASPTAPSGLNDVTLYRYRVSFRRADGRNTQGVDVPWTFDGAATITLASDGASAQVPFDLVRHQMKLEPPLRNLVNAGSAMFISTIAEITFWGRDQAGNEITATGMMTVNFGDFADPE